MAVAVSFSWAVRCGRKAGLTNLALLGAGGVTGQVSSRSGGRMGRDGVLLQVDLLGLRWLARHDGDGWPMRQTVKSRMESRGGRDGDGEDGRGMWRGGDEATARWKKVWPLT
jgi:hypothetical protein